MKLTKEAIRQMAKRGEDITQLDVSHLTDMSGLFWGFEDFNQDISRWDVSQVTDMSGMFAHCTKFNQDISGWDVRQVTDMSSMFYNCSSLTHTMYWNVHPDCEFVPTDIVKYLPFNQELKQKVLSLLKEYSFMEAINQILADPSTSSKELYELLKYQQSEISKDLSLKEGNR